jgi:hypothetical protein
MSIVRHRVGTIWAPDYGPRSTEDTPQEVVDEMEAIVGSITFGE